METGAGNKQVTTYKRRSQEAGKSQEVIRETITQSEGRFNRGTLHFELEEVHASAFSGIARKNCRNNVYYAMCDDP